MTASISSFASLLTLRPTIEKEARALIVERIREGIMSCSRSDYPETFLQGMVRAMEIAEVTHTVADDDDPGNGQQRLF